MSARELWVVDLGLVDYDEALAFQRQVAADRITQRVPQDVLILCEHPPVVTMGRSAKAANLLVPEPLLSARGIQLREVERGGDITLHAPGQLVGYPIIDLRRHKEDLHWYLRCLEQVLIDALAATGIGAGRRDKLTGVWVEDRKIASIGVHARSWVTWHGFALNVSTDLSLFDVMVPCGIDQVVMTSVQRELGVADGFAVRAAVVRAMGAVFGMRAEGRSALRLAQE